MLRTIIVLALAGCTYSGIAYDPRIPIYAPNGIPDTALGHVGEKERSRYRCVTGVMMCRSFGVSMQCRCEL